MVDEGKLVVGKTMRSTPPSTTAYRRLPRRRSCRGSSSSGSSIPTSTSTNYETRFPRRKSPFRAVAVLTLGAASLAPDALRFPPPGAARDDALATGARTRLARSLNDEVGARPGGPRAAGARGGAGRSRDARARAQARAHRAGQRAGYAARPCRDRAAARQRLPAPGPGAGVATPPGGLAADVVEVGSFDELKALGDRAQGQDRALQTTPMSALARFEQYGRAVGPPRGGSAMAAAHAGRGPGVDPLGGDRRLSAAAHRRRALRRRPSADPVRGDHRRVRRSDPPAARAQGSGAGEGAASRSPRACAARCRAPTWLGDIPGTTNPRRDCAPRRAPRLLGRRPPARLDDAAGCGIVLEAARLIAAHLPAPSPPSAWCSS